MGSALIVMRLCYWRESNFARIGEGLASQGYSIDSQGFGPQPGDSQMATEAMRDLRLTQSQSI